MPEVIKVTTKGQITIPARIRKKLKIDKESYIAVDTIGDYVIMKKVGLKLKEISEIVSEHARKEGIKKEDIEKAIRESREEVWYE